MPAPLTPALREIADRARKLTPPGARVAVSHLIATRIVVLADDSAGLEPRGALGVVVVDDEGAGGLSVRARASHPALTVAEAVGLIASHVAVRH
jgi:hypothetical protein